jgi:hypothetical protein
MLISTMFDSNEEDLSPLLQYGCKDFLQNIIDRKNKSLDKQRQFEIDKSW